MQNNRFREILAQKFNAMQEHGFPMKKIFVVLAVVSYCTAVAVTASVYKGEKSEYLLFSMSAAFMLYMAFGKGLGYGAPLLSIFLWLGLWLKPSVHFVFSFPFPEATGGFQFSPSEYDEYMNVAMLACLGLSCAWIVSTRYLGRKQNNHPPSYPYLSGYAPSSLNNYLWIMMILIIVSLNIVNIQFSITRTGMVSHRIFPFPINAVFSWFLYIGISFMIATVFNFLTEKKISKWMFVVLLEGFFTGLSLISRGIYVWHVLPIFLVLWTNVRKFKKFLSVCSLIRWSILALIGLFFTAAMVNYSRNILYSQNYNLQIVSLVEQTSNLTIGRWVGAEGIMSAIGYPEKSFSLWKELLMEKSSIGYIGKYQFIAGSHYIHVDANQYQFATLPGMAGFFYLSGSSWLVFFGSMLLALIVFGSERLVWLVSRNSFLCAVQGMHMANIAAQIGLFPLQSWKPLIMNFSGICIIALAQAYWFRHVKKG